MGEHNALNGAAVFISCHWLGLTREEIEKGFETFHGVQRRMENRGTFQGAIVFDDFAHHPTAIAKTLAAIEYQYRGHPIWAVSEPRSNTTRRNLFQEELAGAFQGASEVIIGAVYKKDRIDPAHRLDPVKLAHGIEVSSPARAHYIPDVDAIFAFLSCHVREGDIVVVMSNGGFGGLMDKLAPQTGKSG
jgi:UDP-N-acetylmuramate: L-alanyl-gamma-D-glutamyl-meso-diaminopimelate ligase